jgi:heme/copper-type cytochrome/quinol oxidase subunit 3
MSQMSGDNAVTDEANKPSMFVETPEEREFELRSAVGAYWTGGRLLIGMYTFLFASLAFAYFYLRSNNAGQLWRPHGITAPTDIGWAIFAVVVASALLAIYGHQHMRQGSIIDWEVSGWTAVAGGLIAMGLQIWQLTQLPFFPGSSGYASCFIGWAVMNIFLILSGVYWLETLLASCIRMRHIGVVDGVPATSTGPASQLFRANVEACTYFWGFMAAISTLFWVFFYLI